MPANYVLLERIQLNASAASVTFSNIPQSGYTDLKIVVSARGTNTGATNDSPALQFNGDTATNYTYRRLYGTGSVAGSDTTSNGYAYTAYTGYANATANTFGNSEIYIPNYSVSGIQKSISSDGVSENNATTAYMALMANIWTGTAAISSINIAPVNGSGWAQYSTFSLYGLAAVDTTPAIAPKASGGNIQTDGTYWYHTFLSSGTFTPATSLSCDVLQVAGGGGAGGYGGGGGAGGVLNSNTQSFASSTAYAVTVGAGGTAGANNANGGQGNNSSIIGGSLSITATGGGYGAGQSGTVGGNGGSGGGSVKGNSGGTATSGQGNNGGRGYTDYSQYNYGGGGGGAGAVGGNSANSYGYLSGSGGNGTNTYSSWLSVTGTGVGGYIAGGGVGAFYDWENASAGTAGLGGGGAINTAGKVNTGGGGGSKNTSVGTDGTAGGSGITIIRYLAS